MPYRAQHEGANVMTEDQVRARFVWSVHLASAGSNSVRLHTCPTCHATVMEADGNVQDLRTHLAWHEQ